MRRWIAAVLLLVGAGAEMAAADQRGLVTFGGVPVPGATITATQGDKRSQTITDEGGGYRLQDVSDGVWTIRVEMLGFEPASRDVTNAADSPAVTWELKLLPFEQIAGATATPAPNAPPVNPANGQTPAGAATRPATPANNTGGFQRAAVNASAPAPASAPAAVQPGAASPPADAAADGFLINGSVNNGAASPFAQLPAFGNNRRGARSLYNGGFALLLNNSRLDSRPFSFTNQPALKPAYSDMQVNGSFAGPLKIPGLRNKANLFLGYQRTLNHNATTQSALVPTALERGGDFSQSHDGLGRPVQVIDPTTGLPFPGNAIPSQRISQQAAALLSYYPQPNLENGGRFNYQTPVLATTHQDALQVRLNESLDQRNQLAVMFAYQRMTTDSANIFAFVDGSRTSGVDTTLNWSHQFSPFTSLRLRYQLTRLTTTVTPFFANRINVSGDAGIAGNDQTPENWGPPSLIFASGVAGLTTAQASENTNLTHAWGAEQFWARGRHNLTFGGDVRRQVWDVNGQQDARGTLSFTGAATGVDVADFVLGIPQTSSIAFGNPEKALRAFAYDAYLTDDWRFRPSLTINAGLRWEYEAPVTERSGRLVNLDVAPDFTAATAVVATSPVGSVTGTRYPSSLMRPDKRGFQPRVGIAWRPIPGSSFIVRAGYGIYRNIGVYEPIALLLAQQPPLSTAFSVENGGTTKLTLANGFVAPAGAASNTFAVDPNFRVGYAQNWQVLAQRDLPASLTVTATYLGSKGSHLLQEFLPNTYPAGTKSPCSTCPIGFVYLTSTGRSLRNAGQLQLRRRLRAGLAASIQYTLSKATDDAGAFTGVSVRGGAIAQDWLNLGAEAGPSNFDQRHLLTTQVEYTTGVGVAGGGLLTGLRGALFKGWTFTSQLSVGSGLPLTPTYLASVPGTGVTGTIRPVLTGASVDAAPAGSYLNPAAYRAPAPGEWGNAGRNSVRGPKQLSLNGSIGRTFVLSDRLNLDWRLDATNLLNQVTYAAVNTIVGSPQFGLPTLANPMRRIQSTMRLRF